MGVFVYGFNMLDCQLKLLLQLQKSHDDGVTAGIVYQWLCSLSRTHSSLFFFFPPPEEKKKPVKVGESKLSAYLF